jgi:TATA-box binding protein (TBP) (component of TFIID and TFIIIB)
MNNTSYQQNQRTGSGQLPLPQYTNINFNHTKQRIDKNKNYQTNYDNESTTPHIMTITIQEPKITIRLFKTGKIIVYDNCITKEKLRTSLDQFYQEIIALCLEDARYG